MGTTRNRRFLRSTLALLLAALFAGNVTTASAVTGALPRDDSALARLGDSDLLREDAAPDALEPGEFEWLPGSEVSTGTPILVMVSIKDQRAYLYRDGRRIAVSTVSTGRPGNPTPTGVFEILQKKKMHHSNLYDDAPMPWMQRLTWDGVALHAGRIRAKPASHGCVRLPAKFAEQLYQVTERGGTVVISDDGSVDALARAGVDMPLALLIGTSTSLHEIAGAVLAEHEPPAPGIGSGAGDGSAFTP